MRRELFCIGLIVMLLSVSVLTMAYAQTSEESDLPRDFKLPGDPGEAFQIPPEVEANMTKEEIYQLKALPGYFTPNQISLGGGTLDAPYTEPVRAIVIVDEEMREQFADIVGYWPTWEEVDMWAWYILEGGDDYLEIPFGIDIEDAIPVHWEDSTDWEDIYGLLDIIRQINPVTAGCDILLLMSGQIPGSGTVGLADLLGRHFVMSTNVGLPANLFQHEATHLFGPSDHGWDWGSYCIMSYYWTYSTRGYCVPCCGNLCEHRFRFENIEDPRHITVLESQGGTTVPPPGTWVTDGNPRIYVYPNSGWYLYQWEITVDGNTWTEPAWNPCDVIYDYATMRPIFYPEY